MIHTFPNSPLDTSLLENHSPHYLPLITLISKWLSRWQTYQQLQTFWKRWSADYLHELQHRQRWHRSSPNIQRGDPVILREDNTAPLHWPTAVITDVHPGADGRIRVVTVKNPKGTFNRPIVKICPLPLVKIEL